jgi:RNA polymerase sigma-70 factor, ECF subfamily
MQDVVSAFARGKARWPGVALDEASFSAHVVDFDVTTLALATHAEDLFLVAACLRGDRQALAQLDAVHLSRVALYVGRLGRTSDFHEEVAQHLREKLLTSASPKLASYVGRGPLSEWIRAVAVRAALNLTRPERRTVLGGVPAELVGVATWDVRTLDGRHRADFQRAIAAAFAALEPRERTLVKLHFVDLVGIDRLGLIYGVHRATVARWIVRLRRQMFAEVSRRLGTQLGWTASTVHSVYRMFSGELHISMAHLLNAEAAS